MGDGTISAVDPRAFVWWRGVPLCRRFPQDPPQLKSPGKHLRSKVWLTDAQLEVYRALRQKKVPVPKALTMARATGASLTRAGDV
jgi:hypothetical protein